LLTTELASSSVSSSLFSTRKTFRVEFDPTGKFGLLWKFGFLGCRSKTLFRFSNVEKLLRFSNVETLFELDDVNRGAADEKRLKFEDSSKDRSRSRSRSRFSSSIENFWPIRVELLIYFDFQNFCCFRFSRMLCRKSKSECESNEIKLIHCLHHKHDQVSHMRVNCLR
jgi:hypothetical protein